MFSIMIMNSWWEIDREEERKRNKMITMEINQISCSISVKKKKVLSWVFFLFCYSFLILSIVFSNSGSVQSFSLIILYSYLWTFYHVHHDYHGFHLFSVDSNLCLVGEEKKVATFFFLLYVEKFLMYSDRFYFQEAKKVRVTSSWEVWE